MPKSKIATLDLRSKTKNYSSRHGVKVDRIVVHHMAGKLTWQECLSAFNSRRGSATYIIDRNGVCAYVVDEKYRPWTTSTAIIDNRSITIEVANDQTGAPWHVSDRNYAILINLLVDICTRYKLQLTYTGSRGTSVLQAHRWWAATQCPGEYLYSKFSAISKEVQDRMREGNKAMVLSDGFHTLAAGGVNLAVYKGAKIGLIVPPSGPQKIENINHDEIEILSRAGNDLFEMTGSNGNTKGTIYGPHCSMDGTGGFPPDRTNYLYFLVTKAGKFEHGEYDGRYIDPSSVQYLASPQAYYDTAGDPHYAHYRGVGILSAKWYQAFVAHFSDGHYANGVSRGAVTMGAVWDALRDCGADCVAFMDGGSGGVGSAQMMVGNTVIQTSGRAIADMTVIYAQKDTSAKPEEPAKQDENAALMAENEALRARIEQAIKLLKGDKK